MLDGGLTSVLAEPPKEYVMVPSASVLVADDATCRRGWGLGRALTRMAILLQQPFNWQYNFILTRIGRKKQEEKRFNDSRMLHRFESDKTRNFSRL